jgi:endo-1,4-beta-xylanase
MFRHLVRSAVLTCTVVVAGGTFVSSFANSKSGGFDYSHRKRDCNITVKSDGEALAGAAISVRQIRNHFGFGGTIRRWAFDTLKAGVDGVTQNYGETFLKYFDYATPENEMKWAYIQGDSVKGEPDWLKADSLVSFCQINDIKIRGHNLFWNEKKDWIPKWTWGLNSTDMKTAMQERITDAMTRYNGKLAQWDIVNEIIHGANNGSTPSKTMLDSMTGDPNIFAWILDEARKIDKTAQFVINDYNLLSGDHGQKFIDKCKPLAAKFDIIGDEAHLGTTVLTRNVFDNKINALSTGINNKKVWLTELDWQCDLGKSADQMELIMRSSFANKNVEGIICWVWCKRKMWGEMTSYFVDSLLKENATGVKWREVREEFRTNDSGTTDANGKFSFNGFQGKYRVTVTSGGVVRSDTFYLEPGTGAKSLEISPVGIFKPRLSGSTTLPLQLHGQTIHLTIPPGENRQLYLSAYSIAGKLMSKTPVSIDKGTCGITAQPSGCHIFRIGSGDRTYYTGLGLQLR